MNVKHSVICFVIFIIFRAVIRVFTITVTIIIIAREQRLILQLVCTVTVCVKYSKKSQVGLSIWTLSKLGHFVCSHKETRFVDINTSFFEFLWKHLQSAPVHFLASSAHIQYFEPSSMKTISVSLLIM